MCRKASFATSFKEKGSIMVKCPYCSGETKVVDKRDGEDSTRRRRECISCEKRFTTYERPNVNLTVVKKDGRRVPYNRDKLKAGILRACEKRPISIETIDATVDRIEKSIIIYQALLPAYHQSPHHAYQKHGTCPTNL